jgi:hypothetical protein
MEFLIFGPSLGRVWYDFHDRIPILVMTMDNMAAQSHLWKQNQSPHCLHEFYVHVSNQN